MVAKKISENLWWMYINNKKLQSPVTIDYVKSFCSQFQTLNFDIFKYILVRETALRFTDVKIRLKKVSQSDLNQPSISEAL